MEIDLQVITSIPVEIEDDERPEGMEAEEAEV